MEILAVKDNAVTLFYGPAVWDTEVWVKVNGNWEWRVSVSGTAALTPEKLELLENAVKETKL